jgi:uncharacterized repeat protein (TIGR03803 family)
MLRLGSVLLAISAAAAYGQADPYGFEVLYTFGGPLFSAQDPLAGLIQGADGRFYGTTSGGAPNTAGTIFRINADGSGFTELYSFNYSTDGGTPQAALLQGKDGRLYGTTDGGGANDAGTIFSIGTDGSGFTVLRTLVPATDGAYPTAALIQGTDGLLYGTAAGGGVNNCGSIFSIAPDGSGFTVLRLLDDTNDGAGPQGLLQAKDGRLYGCAINGGPTSSGGTIFSIAPDGSGFTVLRDLMAPTDGGAAFATLVQGNDGRLYGTASNGGANYADNFSGTIFSIAMDGTGFTVLHSFTSGTEGGYPLAGLIQASDGNLYGTTSQAGPNGNGTIFSVATNGSGFTVLRSLALATDGANPQGALLQARDGNLYGATEYGGVYYSGTLFGIAPVGGGVNPVPAPPTPTPPAPVAPALVVQPLGQTVNTGATAVFWVTASGLPPPSFQWNFAGAPIPGATTSLLVVSNVQASDAGSYTVTVTNSAGTATSNAALLTISASAAANPLSITQQPSSQTIAGGSTVAFSAQVGDASAVSMAVKSAAAAPSVRAALPAGAVSASFQWFYEGNAIAGATGSTYVLQNATWENAGSYSCLVTDSAGALVSSAAMLDVVTGTTDPGRITNLSCRAPVGTDGNIVIAGFEIAGGSVPGSLPVLVRASGPAIAAAPFNVPGTLADPALTLVNVGAGPNTIVGTDIGWGGASAIATEANALGAFSWGTTATPDSALVESLPTGAYTAEIAGATGDTGVALVEVYDATLPGAYTPASSRLTNISTRAQVGTGGNILIAGFVIGGTTSTTVLIRGSGPALAAFGLSGVLPDPQLRLYQSNGDGTSSLLQSNTGWGGVSQFSATADSVGAFSWGSAATPDSAILVTLAPGAYTAQVSGASGDTGISLIEVYEVP